MDDRGQHHGAFAPAREPLEPSVPVDLREETAGGTADDLGRARGARTQLEQYVLRGGRPATTQRGDTRIDLEESAQCPTDVGDRLDDQLRCQTRDRLADLMGRQPVVEQYHLGAGTPAGKHRDDTAERGRQPYGDGASGYQAGRFEALLLLLDQPPELRPAHGFTQMEGDIPPFPLK